ncbi:LOW QUALITY PROTEIN: phosphatidylethanolamine-binding protein homolog F40A3.3 [Drosophila sulfurigaster albostrigata]|uniref:Phosphatidylethanolamine-binding protein homolog F40A3.3 n=1 Tax=Drosophila albomicans TaxID=7291 RepID=A0A6P8XNM4_DROAB|nr:phosphatidylethanolamine-binding protein homolog F40A3.3 [Drosophila albomicans]XP_060650248.1 phosphatidylethanolamine-binding protein homolog F40A3.3 [Drosophila nasuta]XP_062125762.1 LOW QUALITY PROTEIN: phosphatidylethanolamine-binding protein homolog F40A3.3 [Drosophila sulfurigaster albostrigata]
MNDIVPDVLDIEPPQGKLQVNYPVGVSVQDGNELTPTQVKDVPEVIWEAENEDQLYTLLMVDPDAPTRKDPKFREILHWAVINIPGNKVNLGQAVAEYVGSGPPEGTGLHRYIFLVYRQSKKIEESLHINNRTRAGRLNFNTRQFVAKHGLGELIGANHYEAQFDEYVLIRNKEFS